MSFQNLYTIYRPYQVAAFEAGQEKILSVALMGSSESTESVTKTNNLFLMKWNGNKFESFQNITAYGVGNNLIYRGCKCKMVVEFKITSVMSNVLFTHTKYLDKKYLVKYQFKFIMQSTKEFLFCLGIYTLRLTILVL